MTKKEKTQKTELREEGKRTGLVYIYSRDPTGNRTIERVQTRSRWSTEKNRKRIEQKRNWKGKKDNRNIMRSSPKQKDV